MKIAEICVGNYVYNKDNELCKVCVVDLRTNSVIVDNYAHDDGTFYEYAIEEIKPIPLTGDILAKNGFVWDGTRSQWELEFDLVELITIDFGQKIDEETDNYLFIWIAGIVKPIRYIHELQNLFIALGVEKEVRI